MVYSVKEFKESKMIETKVYNDSRPLEK